MTIVMTEYEIRELCDEFFDAYQDGRVDVLRRIMSDDCIVWHNVFGARPRGTRTWPPTPTATGASAAAPTTTAPSTRSTTAS